MQQYLTVTGLMERTSKKVETKKALDKVSESGATYKRHENGALGSFIIQGHSWKA